MTASLESRALTACRAATAAKAEVKRLKELIGESLGACHDAWDRANPDAGDYHPLTWESHLAAAYAFEDEEETQYTSGRRIYQTPEDQAEILAACPHCLAAHNAIQDRKAARRRLAAARRSITMIGKS